MCEFREPAWKLWTLLLWHRTIRLGRMSLPSMCEYWLIMEVGILTEEEY